MYWTCNKDLAEVKEKTKKRKLSEEETATTEMETSDEIGE